MHTFMKLAGAALLAASFARGQEAPAAKAAPPAAAPAAIRNLVVVSIDTVRSDHLGCYGYFRDTSPALDALAARSLRFTRCLTPIAQTTPSHSSIMTGVPPLEHGVISNHARSTKEERTRFGLQTSPTLHTLAQAMKAAGRKTGGFVGATPVKKLTGLAAGFDAWSEPERLKRAGAESIADALAFLGQCNGAPFFTWVHMFDAHEPIQPPITPRKYFERYHDEPALTEWLKSRNFPELVGDGDRAPVNTPVTKVINEYDGALRFLDDQLAVLLDRIEQPDLRDSTVVVVVADHGTAVGQHGEIGHGVCWDEQLRVPLFIHVPGVAPRVVDAPMSMTDLWPTVFALAPSLADPGFLAQCRGTNVLAEGYEPPPLFAMAGRTPGMVALTAGKWKLIKGPGGTKLFDLSVDPTEMTNVAAANADLVKKLSRLVDAQVKEQQQRHLAHKKDASAPGVEDAKTEKELKELGYAEDDGDTDHH